MPDLRRRHRWQLAGFVGAILVPSLALVAVSERTMRQNRELAGKHRLDEQRAAGERIAREMLARLEKLKLAVAANPDAPPPPAVALVARVEAGRLVLPWEPEPEARRFHGWPPAAAAAVSQGERAEYGGDLNAAAGSYTQALRLASTPFQANYARFLLAGALNKQRRTREAAAEARPVLDAPAEMVDEDGVPLAVRAAALLVVSPADRPAIRRAMKSAIEGRRWHSPNAVLLLSTLADQLQQLAAAEDPGWNAEFRERLAAATRLHEQADALQNDAAVQPAGGRAWTFRAGAEPWLVSTSSEERPLLVAVRARDIFQPIEARENLRFLASTEPGGELLSDDFPGLKVLFAPGADSPAAGIAGTFYYLALLLLIGATAFGASLMWRSLRREVELAATRSQFVASVSHELKTPLTAIRMFAETLEMGRPLDEVVRKEYLETIGHECERLSRLVDDVLLFSKIEQGKAAYRFRPVALADAVGKAARTLSYPLSQHGFELSVEVDEDLPPVNGDPDALEQAILNLLTNAMKYSGERKQIALRVARVNGDAAIQVTDYGLGIAAADVSRIFEKYYRAPTLENRSIPGTGLGLTLVAQIAKAHGGVVEVKSTPGEGSTFTIRLPLKGAGAT